MNKIYKVVGNIAFWVGWPLLWVYLKNSNRTRVLLICENEFLALQGYLGSGKWGLPGGGLHKGEDAPSGLIRELAEETGIKLTKDNIKYAFNARYSADGLAFNYDCFTYVLPSKPVVKIQKSEIAQFKWVSLDDATTKLDADARAAVEWWKNNQ